MKTTGSRLLSIILVLFLALGMTSRALADTFSVDNDVYGHGQGNQNSVEISAAPGALVQTSAQIVVDHQGQKNLLPDTAVQFGVNAAQTTLPTGYSVSGVSLTVPSDWGGAVVQFTGTSNISFVAPSVPGVYPYIVKWSDIQESCEDRNDCLTGADAFTITLTVATPTPSDTTPPEITPEVVGPLGNNGWYVGDVTVRWTVVDPESAITASDGCETTTIRTDTAGVTLTCTATSAGGTATQSVTIKRDATAPSLNINGTGGSSDVCAALPTRPTFDPQDLTSGIFSSQEDWATPSTLSGVGTYTYTASATDQAGNTASDTRTFAVTYGSAFSGYLQPINTDGSSRFKLGSTVPVKFKMMCGTRPIANVTAWMYVEKVDGNPDTGTEEAISTSAATTGNLFRYDSTANQYIFNLSTKLGYTNPNGAVISAFTVGTWKLKVKFDDNAWYSVNAQIWK